MSSDVDAIMRRTLSLAALERPLRGLPEEQWEWLTACWEYVFALSRWLGAGLDEVDGLLAQSPDENSAIAMNRLTKGILRASMVAARLHEVRDNDELRQREVSEMRLLVRWLREDMLSAGGAIGWHPRHIGAAWGVNDLGWGYRRLFLRLALRMAGLMPTDHVARCHLHSVFSMALLDDMQGCVADWKAALPDITIPEEAVARRWSCLDGEAPSEIAMSVNAMRRDVRCLIEAGDRWQDGREVSMIGVIFAARRLEHDINELVGMGKNNNKVFERH